MVRRASPEDFVYVLMFVRRFAEASPYKDLYSNSKIQTLIFDTLISPDGAVFIDDHGMIAGIVSPFLYGDCLSAVELGWWVDPDYRKTGLGKELIDAFEDWAKSQGCAIITMISLDDDLGKYYEKRGYSLTERAYMKVL